MLPRGYDKTRALRFLAWRPAEDPGMCEQVTAEIGLNAYCGHLLTTIGPASLYPERASQINVAPAPVGYPWHSVT